MSDKIEMTCPSCGHNLRIDSKFGGKRGRCKHCRSAFVVPEREEVTELKPEPERVPVQGVAAVDEGAEPYADPIGAPQNLSSSLDLQLDFDPLADMDGQIGDDFFQPPESPDSPGEKSEDRPGLLRRFRIVFIALPVLTAIVATAYYVISLGWRPEGSWASEDNSITLEILEGRFDLTTDEGSWTTKAVGTVEIDDVSDPKRITFSYQILYVAERVEDRSRPLVNIDASEGGPQPRQEAIYTVEDDVLKLGFLKAESLYNPFGAKLEREVASEADVGFPASFDQATLTVSLRRIVEE